MSHEVAWLSFILLSLLSVGLFAAFAFQWHAYRSLRKKYVEVAGDYLQLALALSQAKVIVTRKPEDGTTTTTTVDRSGLN